MKYILINSLLLTILTIGIFFLAKPAKLAEDFLYLTIGYFFSGKARKDHRGFSKPIHIE